MKALTLWKRLQVAYVQNLNDVDQMYKNKAGIRLLCAYRWYTTWNTTFAIIWRSSWLRQIKW